MQVVVDRDGNIRIQRDGPSPRQQQLQAEIQELELQQLTLTARIRAYESANRDALANSQLAALRGQLAATEGRLEQLRRELGHELTGEGHAVAGAGTGEPPRRIEFGDIPPNVKDVSLAFIVCFSAAIVISSLAKLIGVIVSRRSANAPARLAPEVEQHLARIENAIDAMAIEIERVSEGQRYAAKLLAEREKAGT